MNYIQLNKFSELHDGKKIFFCKTDFLSSEFEQIKKLDNEVILITGNSDYPIDESRINNIPKNIKKWYAQNALVNHPIIEPLPLGLENYKPSVRVGHGVGYERALQKESILKSIKDFTPKKLVYSNFQIKTNLNYRNKIKNLIKNSSYIDWVEPTLSLQEFFSQILNYESVLCPIGNGIDTHRLWEVLYSNRIPITIKVGNYKIYELYEKLPILVLENETDLLNHEFIIENINKIKEKKYNLNLLDFEYWKNKILIESK